MVVLDERKYGRWTRHIRQEVKLSSLRCSGAYRVTAARRDVAVLLRGVDSST